MKTEMFVAIALLTICALASGCGPNETTASIKRCDRVCYSDELLCTPKDSLQRCFCKRGYQRLAHDFAAPCVRSKDCVKCGENQEYKMCGPACPEYCNMLADEECTKPTKPCVEGCFCKEPYVLRSKDSDECILDIQCPPIY